MMRRSSTFSSPINKSLPVQASTIRLSKPTIELIPLRNSIRTEEPVTLDVLLKITPPQLDALVQRPPLNLGLVLDRSGSMGAHNKIEFARDAAVFAVQELLPSDRVSVTIFDNEIQTLI